MCCLGGHGLVAMLRVSSLEHGTGQGQGLAGPTDVEALPPGQAEGFPLVPCLRDGAYPLRRHGRGGGGSSMRWRWGSWRWKTVEVRPVLELPLGSPPHLHRQPHPATPSPTSLMIGRRQLGINKERPAALLTYRPCTSIIAEQQASTPTQA